MSLRNAIAYLTWLRVPPRPRVPLDHSVHYFPWVAAAHGSLNVLAFLAALRVLPPPAACLVAVVVPEALAGFSPWRGMVEAARGVRTLPGHGFPAGFRSDFRGVSLAAGVGMVKWGALLLLPLDWQVRAAFVFPILGVCARTGTFLMDRPRGDADDPVVARRRVRAGFLSGLLLLLVFLFPARAAIAMAIAGGPAWWLTLRLRNRPGPGRPGGLTLQTAALIVEVVETAVIVALALAGLLLFR